MKKKTRHADRSSLCSALFLVQYAPVGDRYLVTRYEREAKTDKGVLLSATAAENQSAGEKLIVGVVRTAPEESDPKITEGSKILFAKYGATETTIEDASVYFVRASEVLAVLE